MKSKYYLMMSILLILITSCRFSRPDARGENPTSQPNSPSSLAATSAPASTPEPLTQILQFVTGRNDYILNVDNTPRNILVYVPVGYDANRPTPVVIMYHGSNQGGPLMYENTKWDELADEQNFIVVFPTSWKYELVTEPGVHEKWNTASMSLQVVPGTELKDDVKFTRVILDTLKATFNVNTAHLYATGFSNGGGFVLTRLIPEMNDVFAAYATSGSGLFGDEKFDAIPTGITAPLYSVLGANDNKISEGTGHTSPFPIRPDEIFSDTLFNIMISNTTTMLGLDITYQTQQEDTSTIMIFNSSLIGANNQYIFRMVKGLFHVYPSGDNNHLNLDMAPIFWEFFMQYQK